MNLTQKGIKMIVGASLVMGIAGLSVMGTAETVTAKSYPRCNKQYCIKKCVHKHSGKKYAAHHKKDGHKTHRRCKVSGCKKRKVHKHSGKYYVGHKKGSGHHRGGGHHGGRHH